MRETVLPLQTILLQLILMLVAIALEARVFHRRLRISRRASVEYATSLNLLSTTLGWLSFFVLQDLLPQPLRLQLISYIFFERLLSPQPLNLSLLIISSAVVMFFAAFLIKLKGLELLEAWIHSRTQQDSELAPERRRPGLADRLNQALLKTDPNQATVVLTANAYSHSAILLLLFLRFLQFNAVG